MLFKAFYRLTLLDFLEKKDFFHLTKILATQSQMVTYFSVQNNHFNDDIITISMMSNNK